MTSDDRLETLVTAALRASAPQAAPGLVPDILEAARQVRRRPRWLALVTERPMRRHPAVLVGSPSARTATVMLAAALVLAMGAVALVAGGILPRPSLSVVPQPSDLAADPTASLVAPSTPPVEATSAPRVGLVAYNVETRKPGCTGALEAVCRRTTPWLANADGSSALRLFPTDETRTLVLGWSADGTKLLSSSEAGLTLTDATGSILETVSFDQVCLFPCTSGEGLALSPDGTRVAFVRGYANDRNSTVVAILDLASHEVTELEATRTVNLSEQCWKSSKCEGVNDTPRWSPDGTRLVFARQVMSPEPGSSWTTSAVLVVDADGGNLTRLTPEGTYAIDPSWSPDGTTIAFIFVDMNVNADHTSVTGQRTDLATIQIDGTGLRHLTSDGISYLPRWTFDGRLTFARGAETWRIDSTGNGETKLGSTFDALTAAGCGACRSPLATGDADADNLALWQPLP